MNQRAFNFFRLSRLNSNLWKTKSNVLKVPFERPIFDCLFVCCWIKTKEFDLAKIFKGRGFSNFIRTLSVFFFLKQNLIEYENILFIFLDFDIVEIWKREGVSHLMSSTTKSSSNVIVIFCQKNKTDASNNKLKLTKKMCSLYHETTIVVYFNLKYNEPPRHLFKG